ncbi:hypothetical protein BGZ79_007303 [Entomortierella chlamydospora]|nr:hypothetical protein BGZ79_007303 [Entomortierella chlamydospora]
MFRNRIPPTAATMPVKSSPSPSPKPDYLQKRILPNKSRLQTEDFNVLLLGQTQSGKSTFIEAVKKYADPDYVVDYEKIGDSVNSCTKEVSKSTVLTDLPITGVLRMTEPDPVAIKVESLLQDNSNFDNFEDTINERKNLHIVRTKSSNSRTQYRFNFYEDGKLHAKLYTTRALFYRIPISSRKSQLLYLKGILPGVEEEHARYSREHESEKAQIKDLVDLNKLHTRLISRLSSEKLKPDLFQKLVKEKAYTGDTPTSAVAVEKIYLEMILNDKREILERTVESWSEKLKEINGK